MELLLLDQIRMQDKPEWHLLKYRFPWLLCVRLLPLILTLYNIKDVLCRRHFYFASLGLFSNLTGNCPILFFIFRVSHNFHLSFCRICWTEGFCGFICIAFWKMSPPLLLNRRCQSIIWDCKKRNQSLSHPLLSFTHLSAYSPGGCQTQF